MQLRGLFGTWWTNRRRVHAYGCTTIGMRERPNRRAIRPGHLRGSEVGRG